jgi:hypothetical protein
MRNKSVLTKIFGSIFIIVVGALIMLFLNFSVLNSIIIGNEETYDTANIKTSKTFELFYTISSDTGYHPEPSNLNFIITILTGVIVGGLTSYRLIWRQKKEARTHNSGLA